MSVNRCEQVIGCKRYHILQLGTVMTAPEHRGRGLSRAIMDSIEGELAKADGVNLFGNDSVVDFYPKFCFRRGREAAELREEDCNFFVRGDVFEEFERLKLRIPSLSHT